MVGSLKVPSLPVCWVGSCCVCHQKALEGTFLRQSTLVCRTDGYCCLADIVVATPGRLVDHIDQTPGFSLQQLRFLVGCLLGGPGSMLRVDLARSLCQPTWSYLQVVDEADRMIDSMHQSWLPRVVAAAFHSKGPADSCALLQRRQPQAVTAARYPVMLGLAPSPPSCAEGRPQQS